MVSSKSVYIWLVLSSFLILPISSQADTIRCGTKLIREGATVLDIEKNCGEPETVESSTEPVYERRPDGLTYQVGVVQVDYWYYDFGSRRFPVRMTVKGGIAEKIERLSRHP